MTERPGEKLPPISTIRRSNTHRLIPAQYSNSMEDGALSRLAESESQLADLMSLSSATDDRALAENNLLPAIGVHELVFGVPHARIINAAFTYAHPLGSRFNSADRGAWYAAFQLPTAQAEVAFHKTVHLAEVGRYEDEVRFADYLADFSGGFHDLRRAKGFAGFLDPKSYVQSQRLAEQLLEKDSQGVVYPSVRRSRGTCLACFHPALVVNVRRGATYLFRWQGKPEPIIEMLGSAR
jgi:RES domain-containing protein